MIDTTVFQDKKAAFYTLGCKLNFSETSTIGKMLKEAGVRAVRKGEKADICVIDYDRLHATADYIHPFRPNEGLHYVLVNGAVAMEKGIANGKCYGEVVKRSRV